MKLYVGNLSEHIHDKELKDAFCEYGKVTRAQVIRDNSYGKLRCFGYIEMPDNKQAINVIKNVNGGTWEGKRITVKKAYN